MNKNSVQFLQAMDVEITVSNNMGCFEGQLKVNIMLLHLV